MCVSWELPPNFPACGFENVKSSVGRERERERETGTRTAGWEFALIYRLEIVLCTALAKLRMDSAWYVLTGFKNRVAGIFFFGFLA